MIEEYDIVIIGMGPTGIGAAMHALEIGGTDFVALEQSTSAGGLAASEVDRTGFTWDRGVHLQFSHYDRYDQFLDTVLPPEEWDWPQRNVVAKIGTDLVPYPVQFHLRHLQPSTRWKCLQGLLDVSRKPHGKPANFADWSRQTFGKGLAEEFLLPYNEKIWAHPADRLNYRWVGERVAMPELKSVLQGICLEQDRSDWGPNARFQYPRRGGSGRVWNEAAKLIPNAHKRWNQSVLEIDADRKLITTRAGDCYRYHTLISSMPLDSLYQRLSTKRALPSIARLAKTTTQLVGVGVRGTIPESLRERTWVYFPDDDTSFYRLTVLSNLSAAMVSQPGEEWSIVVEIAASDWCPVRCDDPVERTLSDLRELGYLEEDSQVVSLWEQRLPHGYPVPTLDRDRILTETLPALEDIGIYSRGRFGAWKYEVSNQDHCFMQGVEAIEKIVNGREEQTLFQPDLVNGRTNPFPYVEWTH